VTKAAFPASSFMPIPSPYIPIKSKRDRHLRAEGEAIQSHRRGPRVLLDSLR
jgi:hypothetical protein